MAVHQEFEYIVVGLGGIGSAAAFWLARRTGTAVLGLEQFALGHDRGASEDHSRIIRYTYHTPDYVEVAPHAYAAWRALEEEANEKLLVITGDLFMGPRDSATPVPASTPLSAGVEVATPRARYRCRRLVLAGDAWPSRLLAPLGANPPLTM